jgi:hypothetical protein
MAARDARSPDTLGFLSVIEHEQFGLVGGYLILNTAGRPLEFHCTAPVKPSRAQQILFGPTLLPYLYGEQIGQTLLAKAGVEPLAVCTNVEMALAVRPFVGLPVALVLSAPTASGASHRPGNTAGTEGESSAIEPDNRSASGTGAGPSQLVWRCDRPHEAGGNLNTFHLGRNHLAVLSDHEHDRLALQQRLSGLADFDLGEPFGRIQEAVEEAHKVGRA